MKILGLDGGGLRGLLTLQLLKRLELELGRPLHEEFDFVLGTSTGAILAFGLGVGRMACEEIEEHYRRLAERVFPTDVFSDAAGHLRTFRAGAFWDHKPLEAALSEIFGDARLSDLRSSRPRVAGIAADLDASPGQTFVFRSYLLPVAGAFPGDSNARIVDAIRASTAAPLFFDLVNHRVGAHTKTLGDGGLVANDPAGVAVMEALALGASVSDLRVLSLGTGIARQVPETEVREQWLTALLRKTVETAMSTDVVSGLLGVMLGDRYLRIDGHTSKGEMDRAEHCDVWVAEGAALADATDWGRVLSTIRS